MYKNEKWKPIKNYEGLYEISNFGRIFSLRRNKMLKHIKSGGVLFVSLCNKFSKYYRVSHLVAETFIPNTYNSKCLRHKDGDNLNVNLENIEWVVNKKLLNIKKEKVCKWVILCKQLGITAYTIGEMIEKLKLEGYEKTHRQSISLCLKGKQKHHYGLTFINIKPEISENILINDLINKYYEDKAS